MKKLLITAAVICLAGAAYANQDCFFGKDCKNGKTVVRQEWGAKAHMKHGKNRGPQHRHMMKGNKAGCPCAKKAMAPGKEGCPNAKEGKCPMMMGKDGKRPPMQMGKDGRPAPKMMKGNKAGCPCAKEGKCPMKMGKKGRPMMKDGKNFGKHKACKCKEQDKDCKCPRGKALGKEKGPRKPAPKPAN